MRIALILIAFFAAGGAWADPATDLCMALESHSKNGAKFALDKGADPNTYCGKHHGFPAITLAAGDPELLRLLLEAGADVNARTTGLGETALSIAVSDDRLASVRMLLEAGASPNLTPGILAFAAYHGNPVLAKILVEAGADVNAVKWLGGGTALMECVHSKEHGLEIMKLLLEAGADPDAQPNKEKWSALMIATRKGRIEMVRLLLKYGANPSLKNKWDQDAFYYARSDGFPEILEVLNSNARGQ